MQKHITREEAAANAQLESAADAVAAAIQFVRTISEEHSANRVKSPLELRFGAEKKAAEVDDAIVRVAENTQSEYVRQIARGEGPAERQQFSLGNQLTWNPARALPQFLFQGKPILLTDPEQIARWDRLAKQEARENKPGLTAQRFRTQRKPASPNVALPDIAAELDKSAEGKITFESADRPGWDKVIYYHAGEKGAAERLAQILHKNRQLTELQQAEVWRLEGWPEADIGRELERMRHVQQMHDESWWTPEPSLMERARQSARSLLSFGRTKKVLRPSAEIKPEQAQRLLREIERSPELVAELPKGPPFAESPKSGPAKSEPAKSAPFAELPKSAPFAESPKTAPFAALPRSAPLNAEGPAEADIGAKVGMPLPRSAPAPVQGTGFYQAGVRAVALSARDRARASAEAKSPAGLSPQDEPVLRWLEAAMEDVHRHTQRPRRTIT
ncbi:MAG TPA: hypothetical protein VMF32_03625 [Xanthobacteraceae bacterium]|nr:hypothetical protein [Xanthobacteraceae bacterium]